ncbi:hypothetical protein GCM10027187_64200 [Streptosporangium sandarakinum]
MPPGAASPRRVRSGERPGPAAPRPSPVPHAAARPAGTAGPGARRPAWYGGPQSSSVAALGVRRVLRTVSPGCRSGTGGGVPPNSGHSSR